MEFSDWSLPLTAVVIVLISGAYVFSHQNYLGRECDFKWEKLRALLSLRHDLLPILVEILRDKTQANKALIDKLIEKRAQCARLHLNSLAKFEEEMALTNVIKEVLFLSKEFPELEKDTHFLQLKNELRAIAREIEMQTEIFNSAVRRHNAFCKFSRKRIRSIFEFEAATS